MILFLRGDLEASDVSSIALLADNDPLRWVLDHGTNRTAFAWPFVPKMHEISGQALGGVCWFFASLVWSKCRYHSLWQARLVLLKHISSGASICHARISRNDAYACCCKIDCVDGLIASSFIRQYSYSICASLHYRTALRRMQTWIAMHSDEYGWSTAKHYPTFSSRIYTRRHDQIGRLGVETVRMVA